MKKAIIIDDEPLARDVLRAYLQHHPIDIVAECNDGFEGLKAIHQHSPDLIFLDIQMPRINGFEMLEVIDDPPPVIFTTAFDEFALKAFEQNAIDYLLKPFDQARLDKAIEKFLNTAAHTPVHTLISEASANPAQQNRIVVKEANKIKIIPVSKIHYLESADDYVRIITQDGRYLKNRTMGFYEESLNDYHFVRIHRSYLVNTQLITRIDAREKDTYTVRLTTGAELPVSKSGYPRLRAALGI